MERRMMGAGYIREQAGGERREEYALRAGTKVDIK